MSTSEQAGEQYFVVLCNDQPCVLSGTSLLPHQPNDRVMARVAVHLEDVPSDSADQPADDDASVSPAQQTDDGRSVNMQMLITAEVQNSRCSDCGIETIPSDWLFRSICEAIEAFFTDFTGAHSQINDIADLIADPDHTYTDAQLQTIYTYGETLSSPYYVPVIMTDYAGSVIPPRTKLGVDLVEIRSWLGRIGNSRASDLTAQDKQEIDGVVDQLLSLSSFMLSKIWVTRNYFSGDMYPIYLPSVDNTTHGCNSNAWCWSTDAVSVPVRTDAVSVPVRTDAVSVPVRADVDPDTDLKMQQTVRTDVDPDTDLKMQQTVSLLSEFSF